MELDSLKRLRYACDPSVIPVDSLPSPPLKPSITHSTCCMGGEESFEDSEDLVTEEGVLI